MKKKLLFILLSQTINNNRCSSKLHDLQSQINFLAEMSITNKNKNSLSTSSFQLFESSPNKEHSSKQTSIEKFVEATSETPKKKKTTILTFLNKQLEKKKKQQHIKN